MAIDRFSLRKNPHLLFYKSLGTGAGESFTPSDADLFTWALIIHSDGEYKELDQITSVKSWRRFAMCEDLFELSPIASHGNWAGRPRFSLTESSPSATSWKGEVATITRARISWRQHLRFWRSVPAVTRSLHSAEGLIQAIGIGEAPIGLQGTFSHWRSQEDLRAFAYRTSAHQEAIEKTERFQWYSEELFARFAVLDRHHVNLAQNNGAIQA